MKYNCKTLFLFFFVFSTMFLSGCMTLKQQHINQAKLETNIEVELNQYQQSSYKQVDATFYTQQSKELVFRVLTDVEKTSHWFERVDSLKVLEVYNNNQYLLRTIIKTPWLFKNRELITCVETSFEENITFINISSCSERVPSDDQYLRLVHIESSWTITKKVNSLVEVNYKTWLDPAGNVPAFIFNSELVASTKADLKKLQTIIENASLDQYAY